MNSRLLTIDQVAEYMGVHRDTVYSLIRAGRLPALQLGGRKAGWRITEEDVLEFVRAGKKNGATNGHAVADFERDQEAALRSFKENQENDRKEFLSGQPNNGNHR